MPNYPEDEPGREDVEAWENHRSDLRREQRAEAEADARADHIERLELLRRHR